MNNNPTDEDDAMKFEITVIKSKRYKNIIHWFQWPSIDADIDENIDEDQQNLGGDDDVIVEVFDDLEYLEACQNAQKSKKVRKLLHRTWWIHVDLNYLKPSRELDRRLKNVFKKRFILFGCWW